MVFLCVARSASVPSVVQNSFAGETLSCAFVQQFLSNLFTTENEEHTEKVTMNGFPLRSA